ncbi:hypothetical protein FPV67DRAFT_1464461 [Lyophyllum atratum]|nr:hypothetical protein FPV67DRAFT_1464461 [Lyophyllum atratum]
MDIPNLSRDGSLSHLTIRIIREKVEATHGLERGTLEAKEYKRPLKVAIQDATEQTKKGYDVEKSSESDAVGEPVPKAKDAAATKGEKAAEPPTGKKRRSESGKAYKSAEFIESSDAEDKPEAKVSSPKKASLRKIQESKEDSGPRPPPSKRRKVVQSDDDDDGQSLAKPASMDAKSDSDPSSLFGDQPPSKPKKQASKEKKPAKAKTVTNAKTKSSAEGGKDEATIKRLKSFVTACGVRKPWAKIFQDYPKPSQQIKKLKETLADLGMTGRLSMEQAKKIKAKRELAQELEDVRSFEQSVLSRGSRNRTNSTSRSTEPEPEPSEEEEEEDIKPIKRKSKALRSIDAFLEDQSDDD